MSQLGCGLDVAGSAQADENTAGGCVGEERPSEGVEDGMGQRRPSLSKDVSTATKMRQLLGIPESRNAKSVIAGPELGWGLVVPQE